MDVSGLFSVSGHVSEYHFGLSDVDAIQRRQPWTSDKMLLSVFLADDVSRMKDVAHHINLGLIVESGSGLIWMRKSVDR